MGQGGASFFRDADGALWIAHYAWTERMVGYPGGKRALHLARVRWEDGTPNFLRLEAGGAVGAAQTVDMTPRVC